jgi:putative signal transducing protein
MGTGSEELAGVAFAGDRAEGEMIKGLLESAGIPSILEPVGVDGPSLGHGLLGPGGGAQRVMVHAHRAEEARGLLATTVDVEPGEPGEWADDGLLDAESEGGRGPRDYGLAGAYARIWGWSLAALALAAGVFLLLRAL